MLAPWKEIYDKPRQYIKKAETLLCQQTSQNYGFSSSHVRMWEMYHKEDWAPKNWCFQTVVLEKTFEGPLDSKEIKPINPKGNKSWIFIRKTDAEAAILWPPDAEPDTILKWFSPPAFLSYLLPRSKHLLISWLQSPSIGILEPKKIKSVTVIHICIVPNIKYILIWQERRFLKLI